MGHNEDQRPRLLRPDPLPQQQVRWLIVQIVRHNVRPPTQRPRQPELKRHLGNCLVGNAARAEHITPQTPGLARYMRERPWTCCEPRVRDVGGVRRSPCPNSPGIDRLRHVSRCPQRHFRPDPRSFASAPLAPNIAQITLRTEPALADCIAAKHSRGSAPAPVAPTRARLRRGRRDGDGGKLRARARGVA